MNQISSKRNINVLLLIAVILCVISLLLIVLTNYLKKTDFLMVIPADLYYFDTVRNFYITIIKHYNIKHFKVVATSNEMYRKCKQYKIPVDISPKLLNEGLKGNKIHTKGFAKKMRLKHPIFLKYLKTTTYLLALDADIVFFKSPEILLKYLNSSIDMVLACDGTICDTLNYGLIEFTINYLEKMIEIEKNCNSLDWSHSEQALANSYMQSINFTRILSIKIDIFMDGQSFFNRINYLYNKSSNYLNLIGFHNDYTFGIIAKTYRLKELGLYTLDDNEYYSSKTNKYIYYSSELLPIDNTELLSTLVNIGKKLNRIIIFPRFACGNNKCNFVRIYNLEYFEKMCGRNYRENSFLYSNKIPSNLLLNSKEVDEIRRENDINDLTKIKSQLLVVKKITYRNFDNIYCFRKDNYWQRRFN